MGYVCSTRSIRTRITGCSTTFYLLLPEFGVPELRPQLIQWSWKYQVVDRPNLKNDLHHTVCDTGRLDGFKGAVNRSLLLRVKFSSIFLGAGACGVAKEIYEQFCFSRLGLCCWQSYVTKTITDKKIP